MAGPLFFTPRSVRPSRPKRRFTLAQANSTLPLVKRIVTDIVRVHGEAMRCQQQLEKLASRDSRASRAAGSAKGAGSKGGKNAGASGASGARDPREQQAAQAGLESAMTRLEDYVDELTEIGCELKDYQLGLIDFTGRHKGHDVCLCWKLGEEKIAYWHECDAGFAGRQPVATLREEE